MPHVKLSTAVAAAVGALVVVSVLAWTLFAASGTGICGTDESGVCFPVMEAEPPWWVLLVGGLLGACVGALSVWAFRLLFRVGQRGSRATGHPSGSPQPESTITQPRPKDRGEDDQN